MPKGTDGARSPQQDDAEGQAKAAEVEAKPPAPPLMADCATRNKAEAHERPKKASKKAASKPASGQRPQQSQFGKPQFGKRRIIAGQVHEPGLLERFLAAPIEKNEGSKKPAHRRTGSGKLGEVAAEIMKKKQEGKSVRQIAKDLGRQPSDVRRIFARYTDVNRNTLVNEIVKSLEKQAEGRVRRTRPEALRQAAELRERDLVRSRIVSLLAARGRGLLGVQ